MYFNYFCTALAAKVDICTMQVNNIERYIWAVEKYNKEQNLCISLPLLLHNTVRRYQDMIDICSDIHNFTTSRKKYLLVNGSGLCYEQVNGWVSEWVRDVCMSH